MESIHDDDDDDDNVDVLEQQLPAAAEDNTRGASVDRDDDDDMMNPSSSSSRPDNDSNSSSSLPLARHHSYLPGTIAVVQQDAQTRTRTDPNRLNGGVLNHDDDLHELAVMELEDIVVFPGSTIPIRFTDNAWKQFYYTTCLQQQQQQHAPRCGDGAVVQFGILCRDTTTGPEDNTNTEEEQDVTAMLPFRQPRQQQRQQRLDRQQPQQQRRRYSSWTRQGYGPTRLRRLSERLIAELGQDFTWDDDDEDNVTAAATNANAVVTDNDDDINTTNEISTRTTTTRQQRLQQLQQAEREKRLSKNRLSYIGRIGTIVTVVLAHGQDEDDDTTNVDTSNNNRTRTSQSESRRAPSAAIQAVTAIGTARFQIVQYRSQEEEQDYEYQLRQQQQEQYPPFPYRNNGGTGGIKYFRVEVFNDAPISSPSGIIPLSWHCDDDDNPITGDGGYRNYASLRKLHYLSIVSPMPFHALFSIWPHRLAQMIQCALQKSPTYSGLADKGHVVRTNDDETEGNMPQRKRRIFRDDSSVLDVDTMDPVAYSFWLSSNLPLSQDEKLQLLEMRSVVERLLFLRDKVLQTSSSSTTTADRAQPPEAVLHCRNCMVPISRGRHIFTVNGAEGTSGNYVNVHGVVHQTITVRQVYPDEVWYQGGPVTQDSWFPGYSWTIMACAICGHHLGWQFRSVQQRQLPPRGTAVVAENTNRPAIFYGLSAANIETIFPSATTR